MAKLRKYQSLWEQIKEYKELQVQLQPLTITNDQATKQFNTLKKAISKEKYMDGHYRRDNPNSRIEFTLDQDTKIVTFVLEDSTVIQLGDL